MADTQLPLSGTLKVSHDFQFEIHPRRFTPAIFLKGCLANPKYAHILLHNKPIRLKAVSNCGCIFQIGCVSDEGALLRMICFRKF